MPESQDVVLSVDRVSKRFSRDLSRSLAYGLIDILRELSGTRAEVRRLRKTEFWAVDEVSFELHKGETLGLIGRNGSGKSTLLKLIGGIMKPDRGRIEYLGRIAPLISLGAGFNPVLTGRENILTNLAILGLSRKEIHDRIDEVIEFAEIDDAIDAPLQTYSSGMTARLGFACAVHTDPDILLMDEVLSVGDVKFRGKCYRKLYELRASGVSSILVSHNTNAMLSMTSRVLYLHKGRKVVEGDAVSVMTRYEEDLLAVSDLNPQAGLAAGASPRANELGLWIESVDFVDEKGLIAEPLVSGRPIRLSIRYRATRDVQDVGVTVLVRELADENEVVQNLSSERDGELFTIAPGSGSLDLSLPVLGFRPGLYTAKIYLSSPGMFQYDMVEQYRFRVTAGANMSQCLYYQPREWSARRLFEEADAAADVQAGGER